MGGKTKLDIFLSLLLLMEHSTFSQRYDFTSYVLEDNKQTPYSKWPLASR